MLDTNYIYELKDNFNANKIKRKIGFFPNEKEFILIYDKKEVYLVPISKELNTYEDLIKKKIKTFGCCQTILIKKVAKDNNAILLSYSFPILEKFLKRSNKKVAKDVYREIYIALCYLLSRKKRGSDLFYTNIDYLKIILDKTKV